MTWARVSSQFCFCWLSRASPSLAEKNIINLISGLTIWWCPCVEPNRFLEGTNRTLCTPGSRRKEPWLHKRLTKTCLGVTRSLQQRCGLVGALSVAVHAWDLLKELAIIFITSTIVWPQVNNRREHSSTHPQKIGLKIYWAWPRPSEDPVYPSVSLSNQEASISLLSFSTRGQTENHSHRILTNVITWTTALSNSQ